MKTISYMIKSNGQHEDSMGVKDFFLIAGKNNVNNENVKV
jgi:hypothetical protein